MMKIAITGGIGSGKSFVCRKLSERGIYVYDCDNAAKRIINTSHEVQSNLKNVVGDNVFVDGVLNKTVLTKYLMKNEDNMLRINNIVHPAVAEDFIKSGALWMECALLFSSGFNKLVDKVICVTAPYDIRVSRIMKRDKISRQMAEEWIVKQMPQSEVLRLSNYEIANGGTDNLDLQIDMILKSLGNYGYALKL